MLFEQHFPLKKPVTRFLFTSLCITIQSLLTLAESTQLGWLTVRQQQCSEQRTVIVKEVSECPSDSAKHVAHVSLIVMHRVPAKCFCNLAVSTSELAVDAGLICRAVK